MNRLSRILSLVLAVQLVVLVIVFWPQSSSTDSGADSALMNLDSADVTRIVIGDKETSLALSHTDRGWVIPEYHQLPADPDKISAALQTLPGLSRGWPIAQTAAAHQRFEVSEENYQRKLQFANATDTLATLYLGTSPGFRKVHARLEGEDAVYAVEFNTFDLPVTESGWLDQTLLQLSDISAVQGLDYELQRDGDRWRLAGGETPAPAVVDGLVNGLESLRVQGSVDVATAKLLRDTQAPPTLTVSSGDKTYEYWLYEIEDAYYLKRADIDIYFSVSALDYDRLNDVNAARLLPADAPEEETGGEDADTAMEEAESPDGE